MLDAAIEYDHSATFFNRKYLPHTIGADGCLKSDNSKLSIRAFLPVPRWDSLFVSYDRSGYDLWGLLEYNIDGSELKVDFNKRGTRFKAQCFCFDPFQNSVFMLHRIAGVWIIVELHRGENFYPNYSYTVLSWRVTESKVPSYITCTDTSALAINIDGEDDCYLFATDFYLSKSGIYSFDRKRQSRLFVDLTDRVSIKELAYSRKTKTLLGCKQIPLEDHFVVEWSVPSGQLLRSFANRIDIGISQDFYPLQMTLIHNEELICLIYNLDIFYVFLNRDGKPIHEYRHPSRIFDKFGKMISYEIEDTSILICSENKGIVRYPVKVTSEIPSLYDMCFNLLVRDYIL